MLRPNEPAEEGSSCPPCIRAKFEGRDTEYVALPERFGDEKALRQRAADVLGYSTRHLSLEQIAVRLLLSALEEMHENRSVISERHLTTDTHRIWIADAALSAYEDLSKFETASAMANVFEGFRIQAARQLGIERHLIWPLLEWVREHYGVMVAVYASTAVNQSAANGWHTSHRVSDRVFEALVRDNEPFVPLLFASEIASRILQGEGFLWRMPAGPVVVRSPRQAHLIRYRSMSTTYRRGALGERDEKLTPEQGIRRYHDHASVAVRAPGAFASRNLTAYFQAALFAHVDEGLALPEGSMDRIALREPIEAGLQWNTDIVESGPWRKMRTATRTVNAFDHRRHVIDFVAESAERGLIEGPDVQEVIGIERSLLDQYDKESVEALVPHCDFGLTYFLVQQAIKRGRIRGLDDPLAQTIALSALRTAPDQPWWSIGWDKGIFERYGIDEELIRDTFYSTPPGRPTFRSRLIETLAEHVVDIDWHRVQLRFGNRYLQLDLPGDPGFYESVGIDWSMFRRRPVDVLLRMGARDIPAPTACVQVIRENPCVQTQDEYPEWPGRQDLPDAGNGWKGGMQS